MSTTAEERERVERVIAAFERGASFGPQEDRDRHALSAAALRGLLAERDARERAMAATVGVIDTYLEERERTGAIHDRAFHLGQKLEKVAAERDALAKQLADLHEKAAHHPDWCCAQCVDRAARLEERTEKAEARVRGLELLRWVISTHLETIMDSLESGPAPPHAQRCAAFEALQELCEPGAPLHRQPCPLPETELEGAKQEERAK